MPPYRSHYSGPMQQRGNGAGDWHPNRGPSGPVGGILGILFFYFDYFLGGFRWGVGCKLEAVGAALEEDDFTCYVRRYQTPFIGRAFDPCEEQCFFFSFYFSPVPFRLLSKVRYHKDRQHSTG